MACGSSDPVLYHNDVHRPWCFEGGQAPVVLRDCVRTLRAFAAGFLLAQQNHLQGMVQFDGFDLRLMNPDQGANHKVDGSFIATILETGAVTALYLAWRSITEGKRANFSTPTIVDRLTQNHGTTMRTITAIRPSLQTEKPTLVP